MRRAGSLRSSGFSTFFEGAHWRRGRTTERQLDQELRRLRQILIARNELIDGLQRRADRTAHELRRMQFEIETASPGHLLSWLRRLERSLGDELCDET
jgi:hypothetical protein